MKKLLSILMIWMLSYGTSLLALEKGNDKPLLGKKMVIVISSGELEKAGMGMALGLSAAMKGGDVTIVVGAKALSSARLEGKQEVFKPKKMTHREILKEAMKQGAKVQVCYMCAKALGLTSKDFVVGAEVVKSLAIFNKIYEDGTKVLSF